MRLYVDLHKSELVQRVISVTGKDGKTYSRKQWVKPGDADVEVTKQSAEQVNNLKPPVTIPENFDTTKFLSQIDSVKQQYLQAKQNNSTELPEISKQLLELQVQADMYGFPDSVVMLSSSTSQPTVPNSKQEPKLDLQEAIQSEHLDTTDLTSIKKFIVGLSAKHGKESVMSEMKQMGIDWKENKNEGINWMRASMALSKHLLSTNKTSYHKLTEENGTAKNQKLSKSIKLIIKQ